MTYLDDLVGDVRKQIEPDEEVLKEARVRLQLVRDSAATFHGALRTYRSGSLAAHTMIEPIADGDGGVVLNRNYYPSLGPEGRDDTPAEVTDDIIAHIRPKIRAKYPNASMCRSKRGPMIRFGEPINDVDPTVDLVVALNRKEGAGLWIPNLVTDGWEPSDPETHAELLNGDSAAFRATRRKVIRLAKAWNGDFKDTGASSFLMSVWAYEFVESGQGVTKGLWSVFDQAATRLEKGEQTVDPAGVSSDLQPRIHPDLMAKRLRLAATHLVNAMNSEDESEVRKEMSLIFKSHVLSSETAALKSSISLIGSGAAVSAAAIGVGVTATAGAAYRAYGGN
ncbi:hypothetical protein ACXR2W_11955 [Leucobacter sp. HY1908]